MHFSTSRRLLPVVMAGLALVACSSDDDTSPTPAPSSTTPTPTPTTAPTTTPAATKDIVDTAVSAGSFKTLVAAVQAAGLESTLRGTGPFTVFAPTDEAFGKLPSFLVTKLVSAPYKTELALVLKYHVLAGSVPAKDIVGKKSTPTTVEGAKLDVDGSGATVLVGAAGAKVTKTDIATTNGIIHVVDGVLLPSIVDTAVGYDDGTNKFATLVTAVTAAELGATLSGPGTFTVFAPTDKAFADLKASIGDTAFAAILADKAKLQKILKYHVLSSVAYSPNIAAGSVTTLEGDALTLSVSGADVSIADSTTTAAKVILTDLPNNNGVVHAIDKVLLPPGI